MKVSLNKIIESLDSEFTLSTNNTNIILNGVNSTNNAIKNQLTFIDEKRDDKLLLFEKSDASVLIVDKSFINEKSDKSKICIYVQNPKFVFTKIYNDFFKETISIGIHRSVIIHPEALIDKNVLIEPNCVIGKSIINSGSIIKSNVSIGDNVTIGENVLINSGCVLGADGYGYIRDENKFPIQFPHIGGIIIEDFVDLGSNTSIDNGSLTPTIIGYGSKIDNLVHIGHNVKIGKCVYIAANSSIAGSSVIGDYSELWLGVSVADGINIGDNCSIGIGSVVIKNVESNKKCFGNPARVFSNNI
jgi:UDP-3-O-[3-hydroxymyristoyl] glucosamine N-acyltransferase